GPGEFIYFLDSTKPLHLLIQHGLMPQPADDDWKRKEQTIASNREKDYAQLHRDPDVQGKVLFMRHELMVSRFHAVLELGARASAGRVELFDWKQGSELYNRIQVPQVRPTGRNERTKQTTWQELDKTEFL